MKLKEQTFLRILHGWRKRYGILDYFRVIQMTPVGIQRNIASGPAIDEATILFFYHRKKHNNKKIIIIKWPREKKKKKEKARMYIFIYIHSLLTFISYWIIALKLIFFCFSKKKRKKEITLNMKNIAADR